MASRFLTAVLLGLSSAVAQAGSEETQVLRVEVVRADSHAPGSFLDDLEFALTSAMPRVDCHGELRISDTARAAADDLILWLSFDGFVQEVLFDASLAERSSPSSEPGLSRRLEARVEARFHAQVRLGAAPGAVVRSKHYRRVVSYRPLHDEDARLAAEAQMLDEIVRVARSFLCGGSEKRWRRELGRARDSQGQGGGEGGGSDDPSR